MMSSLNFSTPLAEDADEQGEGTKGGADKRGRIDDSHPEISPSQPLKEWPDARDDRELA